MTQTDKKAQPTPGPYFLARHIPWTQCGCEPRVSLNDETYGMTAIVYCPLHAAAPKMYEMLSRFLNDERVDAEQFTRDVGDARALLREIHGGQ